MALEVYRKKRKFGVTAEPRGHKAKRGGDSYVIQKHDARRLHYDLRLELDGVMKSWAVTRGPSLDPEEKRLAVHVEDHPIEYNTFEGTIPKGGYGGGTVMIWDRGRWTPEGDPHKGYAKGHLIFDLEGEKLHGRWHLVRMRPRPGERHDNWLLIKAKDDEARSARGKDILEEEPRSVVTGRSIDEIAAGKGNARVWHSNRDAQVAAGKTVMPAPKRAGAAGNVAAKAATKAAVAPRARTKSAAKRTGKSTAQKKTKQAGDAPLPDFVPPSLATLRETPPRGEDWIHEIKYDGYRVEARLDRGKVSLLTRTGLNWTHRFKPIAAAVAALPAETALLDGELVVEDDNGISNFSLLQNDLKDSRSDRYVYYVYDLLHRDGRDLTGEPLTARKSALEQLLKAAGNNGRIRYAEHFEDDGPLILKHACGLGLEGLVSKRRDAPYRSGRSENFIKSKCHDAQEFVVAGFTPSTADRQAVGALTVAAHENGELRYAGRIGTGFTHKVARDLWRRLKALQTDRAPVALPKDERRKDVIWVKPQLVVEAEFRGVTHGNLLRQAAYKGLREDKPAREVVREVPAAAAVAAQRQTVRKSATAKPAKPMAKAAKAKAAKTPTPKTKAAKPPARKKIAGKNAGKNADVADVHLTHPDRVYWADVGVTKADLAAYYVSVWDWIAPHIVGRPLSLVRCPDGTAGQCFFQKHIASNVKDSPLRRAVDAKEHDVIIVEKIDDVVALVQTGSLELHVRGSRLESLELCDRMVFDLDPGEGVGWNDIVAAAREIRERLEALKLKSFVKLSGGKGIHVVVPIVGADWDAAKDFTQRITLAMAADSPQRYVGKMTKSLRGGKIFIDYFRNTREATSVAAYSTRARPGAAVSAPLSWEQLGRTKGANAFTVLNLKKLFKNDPWADIGKVRQKLPVK